MTDDLVFSHAPAAADASAERYRRYVLAMIVVVAIFNYLDRQILSMLLEPLKLEFGLSDTQLGFLSGFSFSVFYALFSLSLARAADTANRSSLIAIVTALWSVMTAACGLAVGFWSLLAARLVVAVGESGSSPASQALISDYYTPGRRGGAMGVYAAGIYVGILLGFLLGGWITQSMGWRTAFVVVGLPGLLVALLFRLTVKEPPRGASEGVAGPAATSFTQREAYRYMWSRRSFRFIPIAMGFASCVTYGNLVWAPSVFIRSYHMNAAHVGTWLALTAGAAGMVGAYYGGRLCDWVVRTSGEARWYMWLPAAGMALALPLFAIVYLLPNPSVALALFSVPWILSNFWIAPTFALVQSLAPLRMRATAVAMMNLINLVVGLGIGTQLVGVLADAFVPHFGADSLRYALLGILLVTDALSALCFFAASRATIADLAKCRSLP
jgi:predicted MFS family arabinose efflux permease